MIERWVGLEEAYKKRKLMSESKIHSVKAKEKYVNRKLKGICVTCGRREAEKGFVNCYKCRLRKRKYWKTSRKKRVKEFRELPTTKILTDFGSGFLLQ